MSLNSYNIVSILVPSLNEESGIKKTLKNIPKKIIHDLGFNLEVIVIDGHSTDCTRDIASAMGAKILIEECKGYGIAYKNAFRETKGNIIITMDADGSYPAYLIPKYIELIRNGDLDFISVNRFSAMEKGAMSLTHKIGNRILSFTINLLYSIKINDSQSGMWIMKRSFLDKISLISNDMSLSEEIKIIAFKYFKAIEVDGGYFKRSGSSNFKTVRHGWQNFWFLFAYKKYVSSFARTKIINSSLPSDKDRH